MQASIQQLQTTSNQLLVGAVALLGGFARAQYRLNQGLDLIIIVEDRVHHYPSEEWHMVRTRSCTKHVSSSSNCLVLCYNDAS